MAREGNDGNGGEQSTPQSKRGLTDESANPLFLLWCRSRDLNPDGFCPLPPQDSVSTRFHHFGIQFASGSDVSIFRSGLSPGTYLFNTTLSISKEYASAARYRVYFAVWGAAGGRSGGAGAAGAAGGGRCRRRCRICAGAVCCARGPCGALHQGTPLAGSRIREAERGQHEDDGDRGRHLAEKGSGTAASEDGLAGSSEHRAHVGALARLQAGRRGSGRYRRSHVLW